MKVAIISPDEKSEKGISTYSTDLANAMIKQGIEVDLLRYKSGSFFSFLKIIPKIRKYDIIHIQHEFGLFGMTGLMFIPTILLLAICKRGKLITTMHTVYKKDEKLMYYPLLGKFKRAFINSLHYKLIKLLSAAIITHTDFIKSDLHEVANVPNEKVVVIPQGVVNNPRFDKEKSKKKLGISGPLYLAIGHVVPAKGFDVVVEQAKSIGKTIVVAGDAPGVVKAKYAESLKEYVKSNHLEDIVKFYINDDFNSRQEIWWTYFSAADLILLPYKKMTTSGIFINAMESRKPVIGSNSRYFLEISTKYGCVKTVERNEDYSKAVKEAMKNLKKMELEADRFAKNNSLDSIAQKTIDLYKSVLS